MNILIIYLLSSTLTLPEKVTQLPSEKKVAEFSYEQYSPGFKDSIKVTVEARIVVEKNGTVSDIYIAKIKCKCNKELKKEVETEAKRMISENPPAPKKDKKGNPIKSYFKQMIIFRIAEDE